MPHAIVITPAESHWNPPGTKPLAPGEYRAALEPASAGASNRRWWDGKCWSRPYDVRWPEANKAKQRSESDGFWPYWLPNED